MKSNYNLKYDLSYYLSVNVDQKSFSLSESADDGLDLVVIVVEGRFGVRAALSGLVDFAVDIKSCSESLSR